MTDNITPLNVLNQRRVEEAVQKILAVLDSTKGTKGEPRRVKEEVVQKILESISGESEDILLAALAEINQRRVNEVVYKILDSVNGEPNDILLAALAEVITSLTEMEGTEHAYAYIVKHARDASGGVWVKRSPSTVTPIRPDEEKGEDEEK